MTVNLLDLDAARLTAFFAEPRRKAVSRQAGVALAASLRAG
jgi:hypothetical protein